MSRGINPRDLLREMIPGNVLIPAYLDDPAVWKIILNIASEPPRRKRLDEITTLEHVVDLIKEKKHVLVLTGAGVSDVNASLPIFQIY
jgi:NAD-dependent deacetylase sirtuin 1